MRGFKPVGHLQRFASVHGGVQNLFRVGRLAAVPLIKEGLRAALGLQRARSLGAGLVMPERQQGAVRAYWTRGPPRFMRRRGCRATWKPLSG